MSRIATAAEAGARACALAVYGLAAALVLVSAAAVVGALFTGSESTMIGAGLVILIVVLLAGAARLATRR